jgi:hypothetical protein
MARYRPVGYKKRDQGHNFSQTWIQGLHNRLLQAIVKFTLSLLHHKVIGFDDQFRPVFRRLAAC